MMADGWRSVGRAGLEAKAGLPALSVPEAEAPGRLP